MWRTWTALGMLPFTALAVLGGAIGVVEDAQASVQLQTWGMAFVMVGSGALASAAFGLVLVAQALGPDPHDLPRFGVVSWWLMAFAGVAMSAGMVLIIAASAMGEL